MGCASSSPMVATSGSDMLKAATHVASDAAKGAENAVEDVAETLGKTIDNAKETVGTAVAGIAHDLGTAIVEQTETLEETKNTMLGRLHLGGHEAAKLAEAAADNDTIPSHVSRAVSPTHDADSLKTTTPEPEIEHALANGREDSPPTPKPTLSELEKLSAAVKQTITTTTIAMAVETSGTAAQLADKKDAFKEAAADGAHETTATVTAANEPAVDTVSRLAEEKRPSTTEWEKYADLLSLNRKFNPYDAFKGGGGGKFRRFGPPTHPREFPKSNDLTHRSLREDDSCQSDAYYNSSSAHSGSPRPVRVRLPRALGGVVAANAKRLHREFTNFVSSRRSLALRSHSSSPVAGRRFDFNPNRLRVGSPQSSRSPVSMRSTRSPIPFVNRINSPIIVNPELLPRTSMKARKPAISHMSSPMPVRARAVSRVLSPPSTRAYSQSKPPTPSKPVTPRPQTKVVASAKTSKWGSPAERRAALLKKVDSPIISRTLLETKAFVHARGSMPAKVNGFLPNRSHSSLGVNGGVKWGAHSPAAMSGHTPTRMALERQANRVLKEAKPSKWTTKMNGSKKTGDHFTNPEQKPSDKVKEESDLEENSNKRTKTVAETNFNTIEESDRNVYTHTRGKIDSIEVSKVINSEDDSKFQIDSVSKVKENFITAENLKSTDYAEESANAASSLSRQKAVNSLENSISENILNAKDTSQPAEKPNSAQRSESLRAQLKKNLMPEVQSDLNDYSDSKQNLISDNQEVFNSDVANLKDNSNPKENADMNKNTNAEETVGAENIHDKIIEHKKEDDSTENNDKQTANDDAKQLEGEKSNVSSATKSSKSSSSVVLGDQFPTADSASNSEISEHENDFEDNLEDNMDDNVEDNLEDSFDYELGGSFEQKLVYSLNDDEDADVNDNFVYSDADDGTEHDMGDNVETELNGNLVDSVDENAIEEYAKGDSGEEPHSHQHAAHSIMRLDDRPYSMHTPHLNYQSTGRSATMSTLRAPTPISGGTSSFRSSPRGSPFSIRKHYAAHSDNKENKANFVADLSSVADKRVALITSPYKIRARCAVCYNKYVIK